MMMTFSFSNRVRIPARSFGFTLVELMIAVAIIGLLASIALPNFLRYQLKAKSAEASTNLHGIMVAEEAYATEFGEFIDASASPAAYGGRHPVPFSDVGPSGANFAALGWQPSGPVYFQYSVTVSGSAYTAEAASDLDGNGTAQVWGFVRPDTDGDTVLGRLGCEGTWNPESSKADGRRSVGPCGLNYGRSEF